MPKITSKSQLNVGTELVLDEAARTIRLVAAGNLSAKDGATLQAVYSKLVDLWTTSAYQDSPFPMYAIDALSGQFQFGTDGASFSGWRPFDDATRQMLRDGGWSEFNSSGEMVRQYVGVVGLGSVSSGAQLYYQRAPSDPPTNFTFTDQCNEGIQVFGGPADGNFDKRSYFKGFVREYGKKYRDSVLADTGKTATGAYIVNLLLSNEDDLKILAADGEMSTAPYSGITVTYFGTDQSKVVGSGSYPFRVVINGNGATLEQIYTKVQYLLRQATDIDSGAGTVVGKTAASLLAFVGDTLQTSPGVFIENLQPADTNRVEFRDANGVVRTYPYTAAGTISFNSFLRGAGSSYRVMYSSPPGAGNDYGEAGAVTVNDAAGNPLAGTVPVDGLVSFTYDYDGNTQAGFAPGTDRAVTLVAVKPGSGKFVVATGTLTRSKGISFSLTAEQDRVYG